MSRRSRSTGSSTSARLSCSTRSTTTRSAQPHLEGRPVVVRAATAAEVKAALARPEVATALVTDRSLLDLDLTELTYG